MSAPQTARIPGRTMATTHEFGHCSKVHLTLHVPKGRTKQMRKLLKPLLRPADPSLSLSHVHESESPILRSDLRPQRGIPKYCVGSEILTTPALSLMTFLPDDGTVDESKDRLKNFPWKLHHKIELQNSDAGGGGGGGCGFVSGKQEFYSLSRQYPLCCVSPSPSSGNCTVRFNLFVRNYRAMLEFYRLLADSEMESTKADFAVFTVNTSNSSWSSSLSSNHQLSRSLSSPSSCPSSSRRAPNLMCCVQLALKHSPYLDPYPLTSAYLTFFVRNMTALRTVLPGKAVEISPNTSLVRDPDGNCVIVHDVEPAFVRSRSHGGRLFNRTSRSSRARLPQTGSARHALLVDGVTASKVHVSTGSKSSYCDSQDSGRFSDSERGSSELDQCLERLVREVSLNITDYSEDSETDSDPLDVDLARSTDLRDSGVSGPKVKIGGLADIQHAQKKKMVYL